MNPDSKIFVAGHRGLAGSALVRGLRAAGYHNLLLRTRAELDLSDAGAVRAFFQQERPQQVFLAAAKVGGILANDTYPVDFLRENLLIETNVVHEAWRAGVQELLFLGSSCIYPREAPQPIREDYLLTGPLESTNRAYAIAKIAGIDLCWSYNRQYGTRYLAAMPCNLYGLGDNYDLAASHVVPALIRKCHEAKLAGARQVTAWGSGSPLRELLWSDDMAQACILLMQQAGTIGTALFNAQAPPLVNIGYGSDVSIRELLEAVQRAVGFDGEVVWDRSKPDGTPRKLMESSRMRSLGWVPRTALAEGLKAAYEDFLRR